MHSTSFTHRKNRGHFGIALIVFGTLFFIFEQTQLGVPVMTGTVELILGIVAGMVVSFYAMKKYNDGIF